MNRLLLTDSYKATHWKQYPPKTETVYSYFESRGGIFKEVVFFGLQHLLKRWLLNPLREQEVIEAAEFYAEHFGNKFLFNAEGAMHIVKDHKGKFPLSIRAVPEGSVIPTGNVLMTVENTCKDCYWLTNFFESLLVHVWNGSTVATNSREFKKIIKAAHEKSGNPDNSNILFRLHDFGFRGTSSVETAQIAGMAHLVNFLGSDTTAAIWAAQKYYGCKMSGFSVPAAEHSTITSWGRTGEREAFENMLNAYPTGIVAVVSDSYNIYDACAVLWGTLLKDRVLSRDGVLVIRPDSGVPHEVVPKVLDILGQKFGYTTNEKFFKVLDPHVRVIQGDGIDRDEMRRIYGAMFESGWSAENIYFGCGGKLVQDVNRDTLKFAFKCSSITRGGQEIDVYKQPVDAKWKSSKAGRLKLDLNEHGEYTTVSSQDKEAYAKVTDQLVEVYRDGNLIMEQSFDAIRRRAQL